MDRKAAHHEIKTISGRIEILKAAIEGHEGIRADIDARMKELDRQLLETELRRE